MSGARRAAGVTVTGGAKTMYTRDHQASSFTEGNLLLRLTVLAPDNDIQCLYLLRRLLRVKAGLNVPPSISPQKVFSDDFNYISCVARG